MKRFLLLCALTAACGQPALRVESAATTGEYKVLRRERVGGEGGTDYIYADAVGRRLYIPRGGARAMPATDSTPARAAVPGRISIYDLESLSLLGEIAGTGGNGVAVDPKSGHGFSSSKPVSMFDTKTMTLTKQIDVGAAQPDGILFDAFNDRVYVFSHPTKDAVVIDSHDGRVLGTIDLGGVPEQAVSDGNGTMYVVMQDAAGSVTVVDTRTMKATAHFALGDKGGCNGLALDAKNKVLFAACARSGAATTQAPQPGQSTYPMMVVLSAVDGRILANLPLAGGSDGAMFNPATNEAYSTHGNGTLTVIGERSPTSFEVVQNLQTMNGARTIAFDPSTNRIFAMSVERGPVPAATPTPAGGRPPQAPVIPGSFTILVIGR